MHDRQFEDPRQQKERGLVPVPEGSGFERATDDAPLVILKHLREAYNFVNEFKGLPPPTLDVGCGDGYGATQIAAVGMDPHEPTYPIPWLPGSAPNSLMDLSDLAFGTVTCFQTIEHLKREKHVQLIAELQRVTGSDLFISTVNKNVDPDVLGVELYVGEKNPHHLYEYSVEAFHQLKWLFHPELWDVKFYWQDDTIFHLWSSSMRIETKGNKEIFPISMLLYARRTRPVIPVVEGRSEDQT